MKYQIFVIAIILGICVSVSAQNNIKDDTTKVYNLNEIIVTSNRVPINLLNNPGSVSIVREATLNSMPKSIGAEEALRFVPGVRIDNQHDAERIHLSIRGQGILTERGLRGIGVLLDGIPINDPSGFAPDLYDVDWATVKNIEVLRGPAASLYGGSAAAGMININTKDGGTGLFGGQIGQTFGSNGFRKSFIQFDGSNENTDYRISYSRSDGDGYRDHQAFWSNKIYEKINFKPLKNLKLTQIISHTDYFQQNPEGLNLGQFDNLLQANPDACPFNEYQKTNRTTIGINATYEFDKMQDFQLASYLRSWNYKETSNKCAEYRTYNVPGVIAQYNLHLGNEKILNNFSVGTDLKWQNISMYKLQSIGNPSRKESINETNLENDSLLANQLIYQNSIGIFGLYKLDFKKFNLMSSLRYDDMKNKLTDKMMSLETAKTSKNFNKTTARVGLSYNFTEYLTCFTNWSQGFIPPSTEELASNPVGYNGFNTHLVHATSNSIEIGARGFSSNKINYEITAFSMTTENDFFRFKQIGRGNQEVFYGNAGNSKRKGIETYISFQPIKKLNIQVAYTYADYKYSSATIDKIYTDTAYVLTTPPADGQYLPNSPKHQLYGEIEYTINKNFKFSFSGEYQSEWAIYTDAKAYSGLLDPKIYQNWQDGFNLLNARLLYQWNIWRLKGECYVYVRNLTDETYMAFTEPDPDGNSYQPAPKRQLFAGLKIKF